MLAHYTPRLVYYNLVCSTAHVSCKAILAEHVSASLCACFLSAHALCTKATWVPYLIALVPRLLNACCLKRLA